MSQDEEKRKTRKQSPPIGGIAQFATFGSPEVPKSEPPESQGGTVLEVEKSGSPEGEKARMPAIETAKIPNVKKSKHPEWKQQTVYLPPTLLKWLRIRAVEEEREISEIVEEALQLYRDRVR